MTSIKDLELRIKSAESTLEMLRGDLHELKEQAKNKQTEPESLFGRWATHPEYGRGIVISDHEDTDHEVEIAFIEEDSSTGAVAFYVLTSVLDFDPVTLTTVTDFDKATKGTVAEAITEPREVYAKTGAIWYMVGDTIGVSAEAMPACRVIRWGNGQ